MKCPNCNGTGTPRPHTAGTYQCPTCKGTGFVEKEEEMNHYVEVELTAESYQLFRAQAKKAGCSISERIEYLLRTANAIEANNQITVTFSSREIIESLRDRALREGVQLSAWVEYILTCSLHSNPVSLNEAIKKAKEAVCEGENQKPSMSSKVANALVALNDRVERLEKWVL